MSDELERLRKELAELTLIGTRKPKTMVDEMIVEMQQLRTQLADARRVISELEAAQGIAVHELGRQRELAAARKATIKHLNKLLKAAGVRV